jgi:glucose-6-phosphate isomerase
MTAAYLQDLDGCRAALDAADARAGTAARLSAAVDALRRRRDSGDLAFLTLPDRRDDLGPAATLAAHFRGGFQQVLVLGTGGSSLGGQTLAALADRGFGPPAGAPQLHFLDNVDPDRFAGLFQALDPAKTGVLAISKSGGTAETLGQLAVLIDRFRHALGDAALPEHMAVMTEAKDSPLAATAARWGLPRLEHDPDLGGRFSVLSTGALPAMLQGLDMGALRAGAQEANAALFEAAEPAAAAPAQGARLQVALAGAGGITQSVLMPYCDRLFWFARWYRQLWAESLGKSGHGTTPIDAVGTVDQHSQLQLYLDGPADKLFTLVRVADAGPELEMSADAVPHDGVAYLHGRSLGQLFDAEARATAETLIRAGRPVRLLRIERLDERSLGALLQHFMLETALAAELLGIDAYDQPAVEAGKRLTRQYLTETTEG